jgi:hypothetical protein
VCVHTDTVKCMDMATEGITSFVHVLGGGRGDRTQDVCVSGGAGGVGAQVGRRKRPCTGFLVVYNPKTLNHLFGGSMMGMATGGQPGGLRHAVSRPPPFDPLTSRVHMPTPPHPRPHASARTAAVCMLGRATTSPRPKPQNPCNPWNPGLMRARSCRPSQHPHQSPTTQHPHPAPHTCHTGGQWHARAQLPFVPLSAWTGDNLTAPSGRTPWYEGPTLAAAVAEAAAAAMAARVAAGGAASVAAARARPLLLPVQVRGAPFLSILRPRPWPCRPAPPFGLAAQPRPRLALPLSLIRMLSPHANDEVRGRT